VPFVPLVVGVPELVPGLTPPVVGPLLAALEEPVEAALLVDGALEDVPVAVGAELVVAVVPVEDEEEP
jgi:hypothetical protein